MRRGIRRSHPPEPMPSRNSRLPDVRPIADGGGRRGRRRCDGGEGIELFARIIGGDRAAIAGGVGGGEIPLCVGEGA